MKKKMAFFLMVYFLATTQPYAGQSIIVMVTGNACMGEEKSRKQTEQEALMDAKRKAAEFALTHLKSETKIKNFQAEKDIIEAYSKASIKIVEEMEHGWYKNESTGECFKETIKAEVVPDEQVMGKIAENGLEYNTADPLGIKIWPAKAKYKKGENMKIYIKGNKSFYARVIYKNAAGSVVQLLPNPFQQENYFNGDIIYEIPSIYDRFDLEVIPPFGKESIIVYGSTSQLGEIDLVRYAGVYKVKTRSKDIGTKTRGVSLVEKGKPKKSLAEFSESSVAVLTIEN